MASTALSLASLLPLSSSRTRPNTRNPNKKPSHRNPKPNPNLKNRTLSGGGEAITYTRLPPKDDSFLDPSLLSSNPISTEIKLRESIVPSPNFTKNSKNSSVYEEIAEEDEFLGIDSDEDEVILGLGFDSAGQDKVLDSDLGFELTEDGELGEDEVIMGLGSDYTGKDKVLGSDLGFEFNENGELDGFLDGDSEIKEGEGKEKGVPAVMRCFDRAKIYVKAGDGGNGVVAFRREKFVPYGGPSGGDGGKGGDVYAEVDGSMNSLLPFRKNVHFRAGRGRHGQGRKQAGAKGEDVVVKVAPGTVVREAKKGGVEGEVLLELVNPGERALLLPGGRGGRGNASFKSGTNKVPKIAENGEEGAEMWLDLELKLVADVGIVGAPNAGKSTLLSAISAAQPSIANYPFTTLLPNLGVVSLDYDATMVVADLPGLLEGAHRGFGLGHEFLRHTERCSVLDYSVRKLQPKHNRFESAVNLVHVVDGSGLQPEYEFDAVRLEIELFSPGLAEKPYIVAYNKMDLPEAYEKWISFKEYLETHGIHPFCISAMNRQGTHDVVCSAYELLRKELETKKDVREWTGPMNLNHVADTIQKQRSASMNDFEIFQDGSSNTWHVVGAGIQRFVQMTNWQYTESLRRFQHALEACGVNKSLIRHGVKEGDTVIVGEMEMVWHNAIEQFGPSSTRKRTTGSVKWPQFG